MTNNAGLGKWFYSARSQWHDTTLLPSLFPTTQRNPLITAFNGGLWKYDNLGFMTGWHPQAETADANYPFSIFGVDDKPLWTITTCYNAYPTGVASGTATSIGVKPDISSNIPEGFSAISFEVSYDYNTTYTSVRLRIAEEITAFDSIFDRAAMAAETNVNGPVWSIQVIEGAQPIGGGAEYTRVNATRTVWDSLGEYDAAHPGLDRFWAAMVYHPVAVYGDDFTISILSSLNKTVAKVITIPTVAAPAAFTVKGVRSTGMSMMRTAAFTPDVLQSDWKEESKLQCDSWGSSEALNATFNYIPDLGVPMKYKVLMTVGEDPVNLTKGYATTIAAPAGVISPAYLGTASSQRTIAQILDNDDTENNFHWLANPTVLRTFLERIKWTDSAAAVLLDLDTLLPSTDITNFTTGAQNNWRSTGGLGEPVTRPLVTGEQISVEYTVTDTIEIQAEVAFTFKGLSVVAPVGGLHRYHRWFQHFAIDRLGVDTTDSNKMVLVLNQEGGGIIPKSYVAFNYNSIGTFYGNDAISHTTDGTRTTFKWINSTIPADGVYLAVQIMAAPIPVRTTPLLNILTPTLDVQLGSAVSVTAGWLYAETFVITNLPTGLHDNGLGVIPLTEIPTADEYRLVKVVASNSFGFSTTEYFTWKTGVSVELQGAVEGSPGQTKYGHNAIQGATMTGKKRKTYFVSGAVDAGPFITEGMDTGLQTTELAYIEFYSDAGLTTKVTPSGGTVKVTLAPDAVNYRTVLNGLFNAIDTYDEDRTSPSAVGLASTGKVTLTGITGATHFKACFYKL